MNLALIVYITALALLLHSYVFYPILLSIFSTLKRKQKDKESKQVGVTILMAAYNEEAVIEEKLNSILHSEYPQELIQILIGSDGSTDQTDQIIESFKTKFNDLQLFQFSGRNGKPNIINELKDKAKYELLISTDANVMFDPKTIESLVRHFQDPKIGLVDSNMINIDLKKDGISHQESSYISRESIIKNQEGKIWGAMIGPSGGCFAIRKSLMPTVPKNFTVDDFYICMKVFEKGYRAINDLEAKVYEDVSNDIQEEFRRKVRIATGNFQNLFTFKQLLYPFWTGLSFAFFSHKVLRWIGPFLIISLFIANSFLLKTHIFFQISLFGQLILLGSPLFDQILKKIGIHAVFLRYAAHFYMMNWALLFGFIKYTKGINSNVWEPTKRNQ